MIFLYAIYIYSISEFHTAVGQFYNYRVALEEKQPDRALYLAVPLVTYQTFFQLQFVQKVIQKLQIELMIYDPKEEEILEWKR